MITYMVYYMFFYWGIFRISLGKTDVYILIMIDVAKILLLGIKITPPRLKIVKGFKFVTILSFFV